MNETTLTELLYIYCKETFSQFVILHGRDNLIGFGLYTSEDFTSLGAIGATRQGQQANDLCDYWGYLFSTDEWDLMPDARSAPNAMLVEAYEQGELNEELDPDWFDVYQSSVIRACIEALSRLVLEGMMGSVDERNQRFMMLGVSDSLIPYTQGVEWSAKLNTSEMHQHYVTFAAQVRERGYY